MAALLVVGIICFAMADARGSPKFDIRGLILVSIGVVADACTSNFEEQRFFRVKKCTHEEVILYSFALGSIWTFVTIWSTGANAQLCTSSPPIAEDTDLFLQASSRKPTLMQQNTRRSSHTSSHHRCAVTSASPSCSY